MNRENKYNTLDPKDFKRSIRKISKLYNKLMKSKDFQKKIKEINEKKVKL